MLCQRLGLEFSPAMIDYGQQASSEWRLGDHNSVYQYSRPVAQKAEEWTLALGDPQVWRLADDYLEHVGCDTVTRLGYKYAQLRETLDAGCPQPLQLRFTVSLTHLLDKPAERRSLWELYSLRLVRSLYRRGVAGTAARVAREWTRPEQPGK